MDEVEKEKSLDLQRVIIGTHKLSL